MKHILVGTVALLFALPAYADKLLTEPDKCNIIIEVDPVGGGYISPNFDTIKNITIKGFDVRYFGKDLGIYIDHCKDVNLQMVTPDKQKSNFWKPW